MSTSLSTLDPRFAPWARYLVDVLTAYGYRPTVTSTRRSSSEQRTLYARYVAGASAYPAAVPGTSQHEYGLALDIAFPDPSWAASAGAWWRSLGGRWSPSDAVHFGAP